jgi:hypothetical protein
MGLCYPGSITPPLEPRMPSPYILQNWQNFYAMTGEAAATLIGLLFVALSFGESVIQGETAKVFRIWVEPTLYNFLQVLGISAIAEMPTLPTLAFSGLIFFHTGYRVWRWWEIVRHFRGPEAPSDLEREDWIDQVVLPGLYYTVGLASAVGLVLGQSWAPLSLALYVMLVLLLGINNTWKQFAWMAGEKIKSRRK